MKLGLIAMSGVRAYNKELTDLGLTLPGFVERNKVIASLPSLGLLTLAGMTPDDVEITYLDIPDIHTVNEFPGGFDLVAISSFSAQIKDAYKLADRLRKDGTTVILGGLHVTAMPEEALKHADSIVLGDGELAWAALIEDFKYKRLKSVYDGRGRAFDLQDAPMPKFELLDTEKYNRLTVQTQRGCAYDCEFCAASIRLSPKYRVKPVAKVIDEIRHIKNIWKKPFIEFADDNTFVNKTHSKNLLRALVQENVRWFTETDISVAQDEELLGIMKDSGCVQLLIGLESPKFEALNGLEKRLNWKAKQLHHYVHSVRKIQSYGISVNGCFILGMDNTDMGSFRDVVHFIEESGLHEVQITIQTPFPGTPLYHRLHAEGRIVKEGAWELCTLFDVNYVPKNMTIIELEHNFKELAEKIYSKEFTLKRKEWFREQISAGRFANKKEVA